MSEINGFDIYFDIFKTQYASEIGKALDAGKLPENIEDTLRPSGLKALHGSWVLKLYDF